MQRIITTCSLLLLLLTIAAYDSNAAVKKTGTTSYASGTTNTLSPYTQVQNASYWTTYFQSMQNSYASADADVGSDGEDQTILAYGPADSSGMIQSQIDATDELIKGIINQGNSLASGSSTVGMAQDVAIDMYATVMIMSLVDQSSHGPDVELDDAIQSLRGVYINDAPAEVDAELLLTLIIRAYIRYEPTTADVKTALVTAALEAIYLHDSASAVYGADVTIATRFPTYLVLSRYNQDPSRYTELVNLNSPTRATR